VSRANTFDESLLIVSLDRSRSYRAHTVDRFRRLHAKFDQQARCYRASTPKPSAAMDQDVELAA
jgi:hypothetical protein